MNYTLARFRNHATTRRSFQSIATILTSSGPVSQDMRHRVQANLFLPPVFGLRATLNGLIYQSGMPYNITTAWTTTKTW